MKKLLIILIGMLLLGQGGCRSEKCDGFSEEYNSLNIREEACYSLEHFHIVFLDKNTGKNLLDTGELRWDSLIIKGENNEIIPFDTITTSLGLGITPRWGRNSYLCDSLEKKLKRSPVGQLDTIRYAHTFIIKHNPLYSTDSLKFDFIKVIDARGVGECGGTINEVFFVKVKPAYDNVLDTLYYYFPKGIFLYPLYPIDTLLEIYK